MNKFVNLSPKQCTNFKSRQLARVLTRIYDAELANVGLKTTQFSLLSHVLGNGPISAGSLASRMGLGASTLTRNLRPLLDEGWLSLEHGEDARNRMIAITEAGRLKQREALQHWHKAQLSINNTLGAERVATLHALMEDCLVKLEAM